MSDDQLQVGQFAPDFTLESDNGKPVRLSSFHGRKVILYFYPEDETPGCIAEAKDFQEHEKEFSALGWQIIGISNDTVASHCAFRDHYSLRFPLLSDPQRHVSNLYDVMREQEKNGKRVIRIQRSTFLIDENGKLLRIMRNVVARQHVGELLTILSEKRP